MFMLNGIVKRKPLFSMYLEVGTFRYKTAFVTPPKVDHLLSTNLNREKRPKTANMCYIQRNKLDI